MTKEEILLATIEFMAHQAEDLERDVQCLQAELRASREAEKESFEESQRVIEELKKQVEKHKEHIWLLMD